MKQLDRAHPLYQEDIRNLLNTTDVRQLADRSVLITGATGLIGKCLIDALMAIDNVKVFAVGRRQEKAAGRLGEYYHRRNFHFIEQDVRVPFPDSLNVDYIVPLASNTHPQAYSLYPIETIEINVKGAENALRKARECGATVLYPSTVEVYGNARGEDVFTEEYTGELNLSNSRACYTESKRVAEALCQSYISEHGAIVKIGRLSRVFGPTMLMTDTKASSQFIKKALSHEDIVLKSMGEQVFSYTYVVDAVSGLLHILLHGENGVAYNISGNSCHMRLRDFAELCAEWAGSGVVFDLPSEVERKGFSVAQRAILDNSRLSATGWHSLYDMRTALYRTLDILSERG